MASLRSAQFGAFDGVDFRQVAGEGFPLLAFVAAHPQFAAGRAEIEADRVVAVGSHRLALHRPPRLAGGQAGVEAMPGFAAVVRRVDRRLAAWAGARPDAGAVHREDPGGVGVARMHDERETDVADRRRHVLADALPAVGRPVEAVNAAMVLLVQAVGMAWAKADAVRVVKG